MNENFVLRFYDDDDDNYVDDDLDGDMIHFLGDGPSRWTKRNCVDRKTMSNSIWIELMFKKMKMKKIKIKF